MCCAPSQPWPTLPCIATDPSYASPFSFHKLDLLAATGNFDFFRDFGPATEGYRPGAEDLAFGALLRRAWYAFARSGRIVYADADPDHPATAADGAWKTVLGPSLGGSGDGADYWVNVIGSRVSATLKYKAETCGFWNASGFDQRFWLCN